MLRPLIASSKISLPRGVSRIVDILASGSSLRWCNSSMLLWTPKAFRIAAKCQYTVATSMERFPAIIFEAKSFRQHLHDLSLLSGEIPHNESSRWWFSTQKCVHSRSNTVDFCGGVVELLVFEIFSAGRPYSGSDWMPQKSGAIRRCRHRTA